MVQREIASDHNKFKTPQSTIQSILEKPSIVFLISVGFKENV
jgi:hypothetical protein